jgi:NitT/TauT family transport system ATP-binding protein
MDVPANPVPAAGDDPAAAWRHPQSILPDRDAAYLSLRHARKVYQTRTGDVEAVGLANLDIAAGEFVSILGPSGCGKSTLLSMVGGLESATEGEIWIEGTRVTGPRRDFGYIFQDPTLLPWKSVLDNVLFPIRTQKRPVADYEAEAHRLLERVGLGDFKAKRPRELSGGMRQRVALCRGLINDPHLMLMDEPFSALDAISRDDMNIALVRLWDTYQKTALFVTHSIREAVFLADRVLVMTARPSRIVADLRLPFGRPRDVTMQDTPEFNRICAWLRDQIQAGYGRAAPPPGE